MTIIDKNGLQYDGKTQSILCMESLKEKWESFGWEVCTVDGHNIEKLLLAFVKRSDKPIAIIADTIKGKGVSFMENNPQWHNGRLTTEQYQHAIYEQKEEYV